MGNNKDLKYLEKALIDMAKAHGVVGDETQAGLVATEYLSEYGDVEVDSFRNVICTVNPYSDKTENFLLDAHLDEIGMVVVGISDEGFVQVNRLGGIDIRVITTREVTINTRKHGLIYGIITSIPPHLTKKEDYKKAVPIDEIYIDVGMNKEQAEKKISLGDTISFKGEVRKTVTNRIISKALDDRICCVSILEAARLLKDENLNVGLKIMFSSQEEIGCRGAVAGTYNISPTYGIAVDVTFGDIEVFPKDSCKIGEELEIAVGPILDMDMVSGIEKVAQDNNIKLKRGATTRSTGTNGDAIALSKGGIKTAVIGIPIKNMHSQIEMGSLEDVSRAGKLIASYILYKNQINK